MNCSFWFTDLFIPIFVTELSHYLFNHYINLKYCLTLNDRYLLMYMTFYSRLYLMILPYFGLCIHRHSSVLPILPQSSKTFLSISIIKYQSMHLQFEYHTIHLNQKNFLQNHCLNLDVR